MRIIVLFIAALSLSACASSPQAQWVEAQRVYNSALTQLVAGRTPCKATEANPEFGPDNPRCLISDATYIKIEPVRMTADQCLKDADRAIQSGDDAGAKPYLSCAEGAATALVDYLLTD